MLYVGVVSSLATYIPEVVGSNLGRRYSDCGFH
jgi:hypothetical protein